MELGEKLGEGAGAEVYTWRDNQVVKLFKSHVDRRIVDYEIRVTRTVFAAGASAPEVRGVVEVDGRPGIIFPRLDGPTLLSTLIARRITPGGAGEIMARLAHELHEKGYQTSLITFRSWALMYLEQLRTRNVDRDALDQVHRTLMALPESGVLCHGDMHADNILMTANGPIAIDWISALNAHPFVDVARQHLTFTLLQSDGSPAPSARQAERLKRHRREADAAFISTYADRTRTTPERLLAAIAPYMVVMAAMRMMESRCGDAERHVLVDYIKSMS